MAIFNKKKDSSMIGELIGNAETANFQNATNSVVNGMDLFKAAALSRQNVPFDQVKGNLFEYIEAAKFNKNSALYGSKLNAVVTDSIGRPHDPADIEIMKNGEVVRQVQAKFSDSKNAAVDSVSMQRNAKYNGMERLIRKEDNFTDPASGRQTTLLNKSKDLAKARAESNGIYSAQYKDVHDNLTDELNHEGISSGGTTLNELKEARANPTRYARAIERQQFKAERMVTSANMAKASLVTTGVISGISNMFQVYNDEKELSEAVKDVGIDAIESAARGYTTGYISAAIRQKGIKAGSALLSDSTAATVMAGGMIDGGVALYSYALGEITADQLRDQLIDTTAKTTTTIYITKALEAASCCVGNPIVPMVVYITTNCVFTCAREIINNANLQAEQYDRMTAILEDTENSINDYHKKFEKQIAKTEGNQRKMLQAFLNNFDYDPRTGNNYDQSIRAIVTFANKTGTTLKYVNFDEFCEAMTSDKPLQLG